MKQRGCWGFHLVIFCFFLPSSAVSHTDPASSDSLVFNIRYRATEANDTSAGSSTSTIQSHALKVGNTSADYLDSIIQTHAFQALVKRRTGVVYNVPLPANLSGIKAEVVRVRSNTLWLNGINISSFHIPQRTISMPHVKRLIIVYQNLGNWSDSYYKVQNYTLATPVIGLLAYDANGTINKIDFGVRGNPIIVSFPKVSKSTNNARCMTFGPNGSQRFDNMTGNNTCLSENSGHFSIVVPSDGDLVPPQKTTESKRKKRWLIWAIIIGIAAVGLIIICFIVVGIAKIVKSRKIEKMTRRAEAEEVLETVWVSGNKMPSASMMRTQPVLENGNAP